MEPKHTYLISWYRGSTGETCTELLLCTDPQLQKVTEELDGDIHVILPLKPEYTDSNDLDWNPLVYDGASWLKVKELPVFDLDNWGII